MAALMTTPACPTMHEPTGVPGRLGFRAPGREAARAGALPPWSSDVSAQVGENAGTGMGSQAVYPVIHFWSRENARKLCSSQWTPWPSWAAGNAMPMRRCKNRQQRGVQKTDAYPACCTSLPFNPEAAAGASVRYSAGQSEPDQLSLVRKFYTAKTQKKCARIFARVSPKFHPTENGLAHF